MALSRQIKSRVGIPSALCLLVILYSAHTYGQVPGKCVNGGAAGVPCAKTEPPPKTKDEPNIDYGPDPRIAEAAALNQQGLAAWNERNWRLAAEFFQKAWDKDNNAQYRDNLNAANGQIELEAVAAREEAARLAKKEREDEERRRFQNARDSMKLKPSSSSKLFGTNNSRPGASDLKRLGDRVTRDFGGPQGAWKRLDCAASFLGQALEAAAPASGAEPSFVESRHLLDEAGSALGGESVGMRCPSPGQPPAIAGKIPDLSRTITAERKLIERTRIAIDGFEKAKAAPTDDERIARAYAEQKETERLIAERDAAALKGSTKAKTKPVTVPLLPEVARKQEIEKIKKENETLLEFPVNFVRRSPKVPIKKQ